MRTAPILTTALLTTATALPLGAADIYGRVTLKGTPPPEKKIAFDALCGKLHTKDAFTRHYVVSPDGGLANVFVYIKETPPGSKPPTDTPLLNQVNCFFEPYVMGVRTNQPFKIKNSDPLMHNVHATPKVAGNREFNVGQPVQGMVTEKSFPNREVLVRIKCDVHPWMFAYIGVLDHQWFAVTDKDGKFKLPSDLPAGTYTLVAYHLKAGEATQQITVNASDKKEVNFTLEAK